MPSTATPIAASAIVNEEQDRAAPARVARAAGGSRAARRPGCRGRPGRSAPVAGSGTCGTGGAVGVAAGRGRPGRGPGRRPRRSRPPATGRSRCRTVPLSRTTAARMPTPISAMPRLRSSRPERGLRAAVLGDQQPAGGVRDQAGAAEEDEHDEGDPQDDGVDVEVAAQAAGDAGDLAVRADGAADPAEVLELLAGRAGALGREVARPGPRVGWWSWHQVCVLAALAHHRGRP